MEPLEVQVEVAEFNHRVFGDKVWRLTGDVITWADIYNQIFHHKDENVYAGQEKNKDFKYLEVFARNKIILKNLRETILGVTIILIAPKIEIIGNIFIQNSGHCGNSIHPNGFNSGSFLMLAFSYFQEARLEIYWSGGAGNRPYGGSNGLDAWGVALDAPMPINYFESDYKKK